MELAEQIVVKRCRIFEHYQKLLTPLARTGYLSTPCVTNNCANNGHIFYVITKSLAQRNSLMRFLQEQGIHAVFHYIPLHNSPAGQRYGRVSGQMSNTQDLSERVLRLPLYYEMEDQEVFRVVEAVYAFYEVPFSD
jgi:dTDP-4-amino-4,6-dideoxygalactose transaminase